MAIQVRQSTGNTTFASQTAATQAFALSNIGGNCLVAIGWAAPGRTITVTDLLNPNANWIQVASMASDGTAIETVAFICPECAAGSNTVSFNVSGAAGNCNLFCIAEISGVNTLDQVNTVVNQTAIGTVAPPVTITPLQANSIVIAACQTGSSSSGPGIVTPYTVLGAATPGTNNYAGAEYNVISSAVLQTSAFTCSAAETNCSTMIFNLYQSSSGGGSSCMGLLRLLGVN